MEAIALSEDSENRITVGGKRKSSGRRSSILKATKSPLKAGVLEDLDPNSLDDNGRRKSKKSRRSSGRRVSFAEKNEIKEFFVEDWQAAWKKEVEKNNLQVSSSTSKGEYREPAELIKGLETLLKGDIQEDPSQVCQVELQKMPEVQFNQISEANEDHMIKYDRGVLLQEQVQPTGPVDVTVCHGGIISASSFGPEMSSNPREQAEEMEYTTCYSSRQNATTDIESGDQTQIFSGAADVELDVTCSQQEIFFRDYPNAPLSSPTNSGECGKMDSKSFLMSLASTSSGFQGSEACSSTVTSGRLQKQPEESSKIDNKSFLMSLKSTSLGFQGSEACSNEITSGRLQKQLVESGKIDSKSFLMSLKSTPSSFQGNEADYSSAIRNSGLKRQPLGEITEVKSSVPTKPGGAGWNDAQQQESRFDDNIELTTCHSCEVLDSSMQKTRRRSIYDPADIDVTSCHGPGLIKSSESHTASQLSRSPRATVQRAHNLPGSDMSCALREQTQGAATNLNVVRNSLYMDYQAQELPEHTAQLDMTSCYGNGILSSMRPSVTDHTLVFTSETENTDSLDFTICQGHDAFSRFPDSTLQACQGELYGHRGVSSKVDSSIFLRSLREAKEEVSSVPNNDEMDGAMDLTETRGSALCNRIEHAGVLTDRTLGKSLESKRRPLGEIPESQKFASSKHGGVSGTWRETPQLESDFDEQLELTTCHNYEVLHSNVQKTKRRSIYEPSDIDVTSCYGPGLIKSSSKTTLNLEGSPATTSHGSKNNTELNISRHFLNLDDFRALRNQTSGTTTTLNVARNSSETNDQAQELYEQADQLDMTNCYGDGILPNKHSLAAGADQTLVFTTNTGYADLLDFTICRGQDDFSRFPGSALQACQSEFSNAASDKVDSSIFLRSLCEGGSSSMANNDEIAGGDMDLTQTHGSTICNEIGRIDKTLEQKKSMESEPLHFQINEVTKTDYGGNKSTKPFSKTTEVPGTSDAWSETQLHDNDDLELTSCQSYKVIDNSMQKTKRRSIYEPADIDVTSCYGLGLTRSPDKQVPSSNVNDAMNLSRSIEPFRLNDITLNDGKGVQRMRMQQQTEETKLELTSCHSQEDIDKNMQKRRSIYEPADIDVTSCHGPGLISSPGKQVTIKHVGETLDLTRSLEAAAHRLIDNATNRAQDLQRQRMQQQPEEPNLELTCHSLGYVDNNVQKRRSIYEPADIDVTSCYGPGLIKSPGKQVTSKHADETLNLTTSLEAAAHGPNDNQGQELQCQRVQQQPEEFKLELTTCHSSEVLDNSDQKTKRKSIYEPAGMDVTSCCGSGLIKLPDKQGASNNVSEILNLTRSQKAAAHRINDSATLNKSQDLHSQKIPQLLEESKLESTACYSQEEVDDNLQKRRRIYMYEMYESANSDELRQPCNMKGTGDDGRETALNLTQSPGLTAHKLNDITTSNMTQDFYGSGETNTLSSQTTEETMHLDDEMDDQANKHVASGCDPELMNSPDDRAMLSTYDKRKLSIIEETESEVSTNKTTEDGNGAEVEESHNVKPVTLKEFLDITEIVFIKEVNMRRSMAPSTPIKSAPTLKDRIVSSLVTAPKTACYEDVIPAVESQIAEMKEKVEQQEMELNASNPRAFIEVQSATKQEVLAMRNDVRRLRSACEKSATREWKERKHQLNKRILSKIKENHQGLAADVHIVEESLVMVDDCFNLLDKMDEDLDKEMKDIQLFLDESEKKLERQTSMAEEVEVRIEALRKSEQELAELESKRSSLQSEKQELENRTEQLKATLLEKEEELRLLKQEDQSPDPVTKELSKKFDFLESIQEWSLEEWNEERAKFTFLKDTVEMLVTFGSQTASAEASCPGQEVQSIQLNYTAPENVNSYHRKVHTLVNQSVSDESLSQMCSTKTDLTKVLEHVSWIMYKSKCVGHEIYKICLSHLTSFKENRLVVEFASLKAFVKFVLDIQLDLLSYPEGATFTVSPKIGHYSQTELEGTLNAVSTGPWYLSRLVETADRLLQKTIPTSSVSGNCDSCGVP